MMRTALLASCITAALTVSAAWADGMEDPNAAVKAGWSDNKLHVSIINSDRSWPDDQHLLLETAKTYELSPDGHLYYLFDGATPLDNVPWWRGSTTVAIGNSVYEITALFGEPPKVEKVNLFVKRGTGMEDPNAAVSASWSSDEKRITVLVINSDALPNNPPKPPALLMDTVQGYDISQSGRLTPFDVESIYNGGPWERGSTTVVAGDSVYKVTAVFWEPPHVEDIGIHVGIVWEDGLPYALTFNHETGMGDTMWNVTDNMSPVEGHSYELVDAEWGPFPGYAHLYLNGTRHAVVYAIYDNSRFPNSPPETAGDIRAYNEPYDRPVLTRIGNHDAGSVGLKVAGDGERLDVRQGGTDYRFYNTSGLAVEVPCGWWCASPSRPGFYDPDWLPIDAPLPEGGKPLYRDVSYSHTDSRLVVMSIDGENYAVVATLDGPPALVDADGAAALGLGNIRYMTPESYMRWELPADAPPDGPIMEVTGLRSAHGDWDKTFFEFKVRNIYHEPLEIYIDRAAAGSSFFNPDVVVEQSHPYSDFDSTGYGEIRLSGRFLGGDFGPSKAYPAGDIPYKKPLGYGHYDTGVHRHINTVYSNEDLGRVFTYVNAPDVIRLEPGQSRTTGIILYSPCLYREDSTIWTDNACGIGGVSLNKYGLDFDHANLVLVADGYPEWAVVTYLDQECARTAGMTVNCIKWETTEYETRIVHIDDVCEGYECDTMP